VTGGAGGEAMGPTCAEQEHKNLTVLRYADIFNHGGQQNFLPHSQIGEGSQSTKWGGGKIKVKLSL
jgi:hypothetical protein